MNTDIDFLLLKAQSDALRTYFISLLSLLTDNDPDRTWLAKYLLWRFERENLAPFEYISSLDVPAKERIGHRRFQLQVLMDVAYIRGHLEASRIVRKVSSDAADFASIVYTRSDGSEEQMYRVIDELDKS